MWGEAVRELGPGRREVLEPDAIQFPKLRVWRELKWKKNRAELGGYVFNPPRNFSRGYGPYAQYVEYGRRGGKAGKVVHDYFYQAARAQEKMQDVIDRIREKFGDSVKAWEDAFLFADEVAKNIDEETWERIKSVDEDDDHTL